MKKLLNSKQMNTRLPIHMVQQIKYVAQERGISEAQSLKQRFGTIWAKPNTKFY